VTEARIVTGCLKGSLISVERSQWVSILAVWNGRGNGGGPKACRASMIHDFVPSDNFMLLLNISFVCSGAVIDDR